MPYQKYKQYDAEYKREIWKAKNLNNGKIIRYPNVKSGERVDELLRIRESFSHWKPKIKKGSMTHSHPGKYKSRTPKGRIVHKKRPVHSQGKFIKIKKKGFFTHTEEDEMNEHEKMARWNIDKESRAAVQEDKEDVKDSTDYLIQHPKDRTKSSHWKAYTEDDVAW
jgi:hypothetical protein